MAERRRLARRAKRALIAAAGVPAARAALAVLRRTRLRAGVAIVYHAVGDPDPDPDARISPTVGVALFESQLDHLARHHRPVRAEELLAAVADRRPGEPFPVAVTFDDDLASHAREALPALRRAGVPAAFFVCGASLERPHAFWWERLQAAYDRGLRSEPPIQVAGIQAEELSAAEREELARELAELVGPDPPDAGMRAGDVGALASGGQDVGFHTLRHDRLPPLDDDALERALEEGRDAVAAAAGRPLEAIAYPHGRGDRRVAGAARAAGYRLAFTTEPRAVLAPDDPMLLPRIDAAFDSTGRLALRIVRVLASAALREYSPRA